MQSASSNSSGEVERIVTNTGPLITLARIDALDVVGRLPFLFVCPAEVREELAEGERCGHMRVAPSWLATEALSRTLPKLESVTLGAGEAAVIELALELGVKRVGIIHGVKPYVDKAIAEGIRYDPSLVDSVLRELDEL